MLRITNELAELAEELDWIRNTLLQSIDKVQQETKSINEDNLLSKKEQILLMLRECSSILEEQPEEEWGN